MRNSSRSTDAVLVIVDISGYTRFVQQRPISLQHAEEIVTELMESIIDRASCPLIVNKLEGDAALMYVETHGERRAAVSSVLTQLPAFFTAFAHSVGRIRMARSHCNCDACANIDSLQLKAFLHIGEIVIKQVRQFEELAGEAVIMVHRMTKNSVPLHEYVLMTQALFDQGGDVIRNLRLQSETIDGAPVDLRWCEVHTFEQCVAGLAPSIASRAASAHSPSAQRLAIFHHLPPFDSPNAKLAWWRRLRAWVLGN